MPFTSRRPDLTTATIEAYLHGLYRRNPDFMYSVSRDFARSCRTPMLVLPDDSPAHPYQASADIAALAPNATLAGYPWTEPPELKTSTINAVREFFRSHQPHDSTG